MALVVKDLPAIWETQVRSLAQEEPLEKEITTLSSILAWRIPWTKEPGELYIVHGSQRVRRDSVSTGISFTIVRHDTELTKGSMSLSKQSLR